MVGKEVGNEESIFLVAEMVDVQWWIDLGHSRLVCGWHPKHGVITVLNCATGNSVLIKQGV